MAKRSNNEGTIFKRPIGTWRAQISINGKRKGFSANTQTECRRWIRETKSQIDKGFDPLAKKPSLNVFMDQWITSIKSNVRPGTIQTYTRIVDTYIRPNLGILEISKIKSEHIQAMYAHELERGSSEYMVNKSHKVLHVVFEHAHKLHLVFHNPVKGTTPPIPKTKEMDFLDENQIQTLLLTAFNIGNPYYPIFFMAINTGMRQGELLGLRWDDLDYDRKTLKIHRQLVYQKGGLYEFTPPKTKSSKRTILLGKSVIRVLQEHRINQQNQRFSKGDKWQENQLIFSSGVGTPITPSNLRRSFRQLLKLSGLPKIRFHDLRHSAASLMLNYGVPVLIVSKRLGHAKASITMDVYGHLIPQKEEEAVNLMEELMTPISLPVAPELHQKS